MDGSHKRLIDTRNVTSNKSALLKNLHHMMLKRYHTLSQTVKPKQLQ